jgi:hypothetical protein
MGDRGETALRIRPDDADADFAVRGHDPVRHLLSATPLRKARP